MGQSHRKMRRMQSLPCSEKKHAQAPSVFDCPAKLVRGISSGPCRIRGSNDRVVFCTFSSKVVTGNFLPQPTVGIEFFQRRRLLKFSPQNAPHIQLSAGRQFTSRPPKLYKPRLFGNSMCSYHHFGGLPQPHCQVMNFCKVDSVMIVSVIAPLHQGRRQL